MHVLNGVVIANMDKKISDIHFLTQALPIYKKIYHAKVLIKGFQKQIQMYMC